VGDPLGIFGGPPMVPPWAVPFGLHPPYPGGSFDEYLDPRSPYYRPDVAAAVLAPPAAREPQISPDELDTARREQGVRAGDLVARFLRAVDPGRAVSVPVLAWDEDVPPRRRTLRERWEGTGSFFASMTPATTARRHLYADGHYVYQRADRDPSDPPQTGKVQVIVFATGQVGVTVQGTCYAGGMLHRGHEVAGYEEMADLRERPDDYLPMVYVAGPDMHPGELPFYRGDHETAGPWPGRGHNHRELDDAVAWLARLLDRYLSG